MHLRFLCLFLCLVFWGSTPAVGAEPVFPRDELFRLVPKDTTFCVVIQELRKQSAQFADNALSKGVSSLPLVEKSLQSPPVRKLMEIFKDLEITPQQLRDEILGDAVVFAFRQPTGQPQDGKDEGIVLIWARDTKLLKALADRINELQQKSGELKKVTKETYKAQDYFRRVKAKGPDPDEFFFIRGHVLGFTAQEDILKQVIDNDLLAKPVQQELPTWSDRFARLGLERSLFSWVVNPRAFDDELQERGKKALGSQKAFLKEFANYWKAIDVFAFSLDLQKDFEINLSIQARANAMPAAGQRFFRELGKPSEVWNAIPEEPLFAIGARIDVPALTEAFSGFCDEGTRKNIASALSLVGDNVLGRGKLNELAEGLVGPDWGFWVAAPDAKDKVWLPQVGFALKMSDSEAGKSMNKALRAAIQRLSINALPGASVEKSKQGDVEIDWLSHDQFFLDGWKPSLAFKNQFLLLASSPAVIERFQLNNSPPIKFGSEVPLLRISGKGWQKFLETRRKEVAEFIARMHQTKAEFLLPQIDLVAEMLKSFDRLEITTRSQNDLTVITLRLKSLPMP